MKTTHMSRIEMFKRVCTFGEKHGDLFNQSPVARDHLATLANVVNQLSEHAATRMWAARGGKSPRAAAQKELRQQLKAVVRTARILAAGAPGLEDRFRYPDQKSDQALVIAGRLFAREAEPYKDLFLSRSLPPTFIDDLKAAADRLEAALREDEESRSDRVDARLGTRDVIASGTAAVRQLDVIVRNQLHGDPAALEGWERARRVAPQARASATTGGEATSEAAPAPEKPAETGVTS